MILKQNALTFGVLTAAFAMSALYRAYRAMLNEVPEYGRLHPDDGRGLPGFRGDLRARFDRQVMGLVGWLESTVNVGLLFVAGFVCAIHLLGIRLIPDKN